MQKVIIDPSIAVEVNINPVSYNEDLNVYFKASENWTGSFECKIYNSYQKNSEKKVANPLVIVGDLMTFRIAPSVQGLDAGTYYYEIWQVETKRIYFKGQLNITR